VVWTPENPGSGSPDQIRAHAGLRSLKAQDLVGIVARLEHAQATASGGQWNGLARDAFISKVDSFYPQIRTLIGQLEATSLALRRYAAAVDEIKVKQRGFESGRARLADEVKQQRRALQRIHNYSGLPLVSGVDDFARVHPADSPDDASTRNRIWYVIDDLNRQISVNKGQFGELTFERRSADRECVNAIESGGATAQAFSGRGTAGDDSAAFLTMLTSLDPEDLSLLSSTHPEFLTKLKAVGEATISAWWATMSDSTSLSISEPQQTLMNAFPIVFGALNGLPALARVWANRLASIIWLEQARHRLEMLSEDNSRTAFTRPLDLSPEGLLQQSLREAEIKDLRAEIAYLARAEKGEVQLYLYDKPNARLIEMLGTPSSSTTKVITYVPGTFSSMTGFYQGYAQKFAAWQVEQSLGSTVAFVYKDGLFPGGDDGSLSGFNAVVPVGLSEANTQKWALATGQRLLSFNSGMVLDPLLSQASTAGIGHSWGLAAITASEIAGVRYDNVVSLSGAWMPTRWSPKAGTTYADFSYLDALQVGQLTGQVGGGNTPRANAAFDHGAYFSSDSVLTVDVPFGPDLPNLDALVSNHNLVASDSEQNGPLLRDVARFMGTL
jgi:uncharacterized protein YukE